MARKRILLDTSVLRSSPQFRTMWLGYIVSLVGNQLTIVAIPFQIYRMTHSSLDVGLVSTAQLLPLIFGSLGGGALADAVDRRRLLCFTQVALASCSLGLFLNADSRQPSLALIFIISAISAALSGIDQPTRTALLLDLVEPDQLVGVNSLWQVLYQFAQLAGPALAGVLIAALGLSPVYLIDCLSFSTSLAAVLLLKTPKSTIRRHVAPGHFSEGLRFIWQHQSLNGTYVADLVAMIFGMPRALFPALALVRFHGGAGILGLLYSAPAVGAFLGAVSTGWATRVRRQGMAVVVSIGVWGLAIAIFGVTHIFVLALVLLAIAGAADVISAIFRNTIMQTEAPGALRGRIQAVHTAVVTGGPRLGDLESGAVASGIGITGSVVSGGLACIVGILVVARAMPRFSRFVAAGASPSERVTSTDESSGEDNVEG